MKSPFASSRRRVVLATGIAALLGSLSAARAQTAYHWDPAGDGNGVLGGSGTWNVTSLLWDLTGLDPLLTTDNVAWPNNSSSVAVFGGTAGTVTLNNSGSTITANGLTFNTSGYILNPNAAGDTLTLAGTTPIITVTSAADFARINSVLAGSAGITTAGSGTVFLGGANTFSGQLTVGANSIVGLNNAGALGQSGAGNETIVLAGGTLNIGGLNINNNPAPGTPGEEIRIAGTGVGGVGALISTSGSNTQSLGKVVLTADATVSAGGASPASFNAGGGTAASAGGRMDIRLNAAPTVGQKHLDLAGHTLTKKGGDRFTLVNADVSDGSIIVDEGQFGIEANTLLTGAANGANGTITVNPNGKLAFYGITSAANVTRPIVVNGGTIGDVYNTASTQTINSPISITGSQNPNFTAFATSFSTTLAGAISQSSFTGTEVAKRGGGILIFSNAANSFSAPVTIYSGTLRGTYSTVVGAGGVAPAAPLTLNDTPLGTASTIKIAGGTLSLRINLANDTTLQRAVFSKDIVVDLAPGGMDLDRNTNGSATDKTLVLNSLTFAAPSAANGYSIGQNQFTFSQGNTHRLEIGGMTMNNDTVLSTGDYIINGNVFSAGRNSLAHIGGNSWGFIGSGGAQEFNALFNLGNSQLRVGSMYGTTVTNNNATAGTGTIYNAPNNSVTFRSPTNIAPGQLIDLVSQRQTQSAVNFETFTSIPTALRAAGSGVIGLGNASAFGPIDLSRIGDGTFRIGTGFGGASNGTITGVITPGAGNMVRVGGSGSATSQLTISGTNLITGNATLDVGSDLFNGGFRTTFNGTAQTGTVLLTGANNYTGGTNVNRGSTLKFQTLSALGSGDVNVFGTISGEGANGTFILPGGASNRAMNFYGGSTLRFDSSGMNTAADVNRWVDTAPIALFNGTLQLDARNNNSTTNETVGEISYAGGSYISLQRSNVGSSQIVQLQTPSLTRSGTGTLEITRAGNSGFASNVKLLVTDSLSAPKVTNGMISPAILINDPTRQINFATYGANGIDNAAFTNTVTASAFPTGLTDGTKIVFVDFASVTAPATPTTTLGDNPVLYALKVGTGGSTTTPNNATTLASGSGTSITLRSGGLIISNDNTGAFSNSNGGVTATINPALIFNDGSKNIEAIVSVQTGKTGVLNGAITADGFTKTGAGTLNVTANNTGITGAISVNAGVLQLTGPTSNILYSPAGAGEIVLQGGQLNLRANAGTPSSFTMQNSVTVPANIPTATIDVNRLDGSSTGNTVLFDPATAGSQGLLLNGSAGVQGQTLVVSGGNSYTMAFGNNALNTFNGNVTINTNGANLTLNNAPTITGTAPIITKAGANTLQLGANAGALSVPNGTQVQVNAGTLDLRNPNSVGTGATTTLILNGGNLTLRSETAATYGGVTGYPVIVNGTASLTVDRVSATPVGNRLSLGTLSLRNDATLTVNQGASSNYGTEFSTTDIQGTGFITSNISSLSNANTAVTLTGLVSGGALVKSGSGHLHLMNANNTYDGGTYIQQGVVRARAANALGTGPVVVNPGAIIDFSAANNLGANQSLIVRSNGAYLPMVSVNTDFAHPAGANVNVSDAPTGIVGLSNSSSGSYNTVINLSTLYGGRWSLGGVSQGAYDPVYTAASLGAGADNLYRLGGGGTSFAMGTDSARAARTNVLTGANNVRLGFDSGNILPGNGTNYQFSIAGVNNYSGGSTVIHRGIITRLFSNNDGTRSGLSNSAVDVFGVLSLSGAASFNTASGNTNAVTLHPGSMLVFDNAGGAANNTGAFVAANNNNRWNDSTPIALNGATLNLIGGNNVATTETVGNVTFSAGARIRSGRSGTGTTVLTLANLAAAPGNGNTLQLQANQLGGTTASGGATSVIDLIKVAGTAPAVTSGMVSSAIVNATDNTFVTYGATNGFANVVYDRSIISGTYNAGSLLPTDKLDVSTAALTLNDNPTVYALRTSQSINLGGPFTTMTIRSGGLIATGGTISPNLVFNAGSSNVEARIYVNGTLTINGSITANGITKFGHNANAGGVAGTLVINTPQPNYASGWTVNSGTLQINDPQGLGQSVPGNGVTLNGSQSYGGQVSVQYAPTTLNFNRDNGTAELVTFSGGPITVVNEAIIRIGPGVDNRNTQIPDVIADSTSTASRVALTLEVPNQRVRGIVPSLTLNDDAIVRVWDGGNDLGRVTAAVVNTLNGANKNLTKIGNRTLELPGDNSTSFTGGSITASQGTIRVRNNGSLGSASTTVTIERNAALEIDTPNFTPTATVNQLAGSVERWNREDARAGDYVVPAGVNLQLNTNLISVTPRTITLNGGSLEGFLYTDNVATADQRTVGPAVTLSLLSDSMVGQNILQGLGYDTGKAPTAAQPFGDNITGAYLRIEGKITGLGNLTKTGLDTVTIASTGNTYGNTSVDMGVLRIAADNALPTGKTLTTRLNGVFDIYGFNQTVAGLGTLTGGANPGGVGVGDSGRITNSAITDNTLTVNNSADYTYNGVIDRNVALTKQGNGDLTLGGANTYVGATTIAGGKLVLTGSISGTTTIDVQSGAGLDVTGVAGGYRLGAAQTLKGGGSVTGNVGIDGTVSPGVTAGTLTFTGSAGFANGSTFALDLSGDNSFDKLVANGVTLDGTVNLTINLGYSPSFAADTSFLVLDNTGVGTIGGTTGFFTWNGPEGVLTEGEHFLVGSREFMITYQGGSGNDVVLTSVVPEPASMSAFLAGTAVLLGMRRRRRSA